MGTTQVFLFLLVAMTYINTLQELNVFQAVRVWLLDLGFSLKGMFWITGMLSFLCSPIADNLTTSLLMGAIVMTVRAMHPLRRPRNQTGSAGGRS